MGTEIVVAPQEDLALVQKKTDAKKGKGKVGRNKRKKSRAGSPISLFARDKISAEAYWKATGQSVKRG